MITILFVSSAIVFGLLLSFVKSTFVGAILGMIAFFFFRYLSFKVSFKIIGDGGVVALKFSTDKLNLVKKNFFALSKEEQEKKEKEIREGGRV